MILSVKKYKYEAVDVNFTFPFYRLCVLDKDHKIYCKFESVGKISKIEEHHNETGIYTIDQEQDVLRDLASVNMLQGTGEWVIIEEKTFDEALFRLIEKINKV